MKIGKINYHIEEHGNPNGEAVVFLNGVMASASSWYFIMKPFVQKGYRVVLHDFKGQLKSDKPKGPYSFEEHAKETIEILKELGIDKAHFIGTSYGGEVALNIGFRYPGVVRSISVLNSVSELDDHLESEINHWIELCKQNDGYQFFWQMAQSIYGPTFMKEQMSFLEERAQATAKVRPEYFEGQIWLYQTFNKDVHMTNRLKEIQAPTLVVAAEHDTLKPPKFSKIIADEIKGSEYVLIPDCGHVAIFEKPNELISLLLGFISKL